MNVFVDTSAFIALMLKNDINHLDAANRWRTFIADPAVRLFTSNYIVVETCALLKNRLGKEALTDFSQALLPAATILWVDKTIHFAAMEAMLSTEKNGPSLVDCSSFAIMDASLITHAFAYDKHFALHGFMGMNINQG